jgi:hypothetical protein
MSLYFYLHVVRRVADPNKDNFFVANAPGNAGVHSSFMDLLFDRTSQIDPELSPRPGWYRHAFACTGEQQLTQANFFEPAEILRDLDRIMGAIITRNAQLPVYYSLRIGNKAGVVEASPMGSVPIYYEGKPCDVTLDWDGVYIWGEKGKVRDITGTKSFDCRLRAKSVAVLRTEVSPQHDDGRDGLVYVEEKTFFDFMRPYLFDLLKQCDWALARRLQLLPLWS